MSPVNAVLDRVRRLTAQTEQSLKKELRKIEDEAARLTNQLDSAAERIRATLRSLGSKVPMGRGGGTRVKASTMVGASSGGRKGKRIRRSPEQLQKIGESVVQFIKNKGSEGASGVEIRKVAGKIGPDIKGFIAKFGGEKLKTSGVKSQMRYFVR